MCVLLMHAHFLAAVTLSLPKSVDATKWSDVIDF